MIKNNSLTDVADLQSIQQEVDARVILHLVHNVQNKGVDRVIIHANDTDIVVSYVYCATTVLKRPA